MNVIMTSAFNMELAEELRSKELIYEADGQVNRSLGKGVDLSVLFYDAQISCDVHGDGNPPVLFLGSEVRGFKVVRNGKGELVLVFSVVIAGDENIVEYVKFHLIQRYNPFSLEILAGQMELFPEGVKETEEETEDEFAEDRLQAVFDILPELKEDSAPAAGPVKGKKSKKKEAPKPKKSVTLSGKATTPSKTAKAGGRR